MSNTRNGELVGNAQNRRAIHHPNERQAVGLLYEAGWSVDELAMTFMVGAGAIRRVLRDEGVTGDE